MTIYNKYYKTEDLFGRPYPELMAFFKNYKYKGTLIDLGCGQGRDSLSLARLGYKVTGMDSSELGIQQIIKKSNKNNLGITGIVGDIYSFENFEYYDIVLLDSVFHFTKKDKKREMGLIAKIAKKIKSGGLICICIQDTGSKVKIMKAAIADANVEFEVLNDSTLMYTYEDKDSGHKSDTKYCMYIMKKIVA